MDTERIIPKDSNPTGNDKIGVVMVNRRMFRPGFADVKEQAPPRPQHGNNGGPAPSKKPAPPETTHAENFYWVKQMQARTPMSIVLDTGEILHGTVEWYDRDCIKLTRQGSPNLLIFKRVIKYVYKDGEESENGDE
jgi:host factor-I protein